jgi:hypothetical protein
MEDEGEQEVGREQGQVRRGGKRKERGRERRMYKINRVGGLMLGE